MHIIRNKSIFLIFSSLLAIASIAAIAVFGLRLGIDFKGGTLLEVTYTETRPELAQIQESLTSFEGVIVQEVGEADLSIKTNHLEETERVALLGALTLEGDYEVTQKGFSSIGPSVGRELSQKAIIAIILVVLAIVFYVAFAFRSVSKPVSSWKYGFIAIIALIHDVLIATGVFAALGHFRGAEVNTLFVVALLTVLSLSVSDTIVIFDRIRENLKNGIGNTFGETVGISLNQSYMRSINTSLSTILVLLALFFFGPATTTNFALVLVVGMFVGTYSSLFLASPLLVLFEGWQKKK